MHHLIGVHGAVKNGLPETAVHSHRLIQFANINPAVGAACNNSRLPPSRKSKGRWKHGQRVEMITGRVAQDFEVAALAASQAGKIPTPAPQEGRAW